MANLGLKQVWAVAVQGRHMYHRDFFLGMYFVAADSIDAAKLSATIATSTQFNAIAREIVAAPIPGVFSPTVDRPPDPSWEDMREEC